MRAASVVQLFSDDDESIDPRTFLELEDDERSWGAEESPATATTATPTQVDDGETRGAGGSLGFLSAINHSNLKSDMGDIGSSPPAPSLNDFEDSDEAGPFSWEHAEVATELRKAVSDSLSFKEMTRIQKLAMAPILNGRDVVGTAETGSGKTLAFLLPICHGILQQNPELRTSVWGDGGGTVDVTGPEGSASIRNGGDSYFGSAGEDALGGGLVKPPCWTDDCRRRLGVRCLILSPTREIAIQTDSVAKKICRYTRIRSTVVCGGVKQSHQEVCIRSGVEIVCACPGRLLDLLRRGLNSEFDNLQYLVFDEADRILDLGFLPDITDLLSLLPTSRSGDAGGAASKSRQTLLFSATMPKDVMSIAQTYLNKPIIRIGLFENESQQVYTIHEIVWNVPSILKADFLLPLIQYREKLTGNELDNPPNSESPSQEHVLSSRKQTLIFARTKARANRVCELLTSAGIRADRIHGNRSQSARVKALTDFKNGEIRVLVATDVAARGIDLKTLDVVINFDIPATPEEYVHRAGRVGRAGAHGRCWTLVSEDEVDQLRSIEQWIGRRLPVHGPLPGFDYHSTNPTHIITKSGHNEEQVPPPPPSRHIRQTSLPVGSYSGGNHGGSVVAATTFGTRNSHHRSSGGSVRLPVDNFNQQPHPSGNTLTSVAPTQQGYSRPNHHRRQRSAGPQMCGTDSHTRMKPVYGPGGGTGLFYHQHHMVSPSTVASPTRGALPHRFGMHSELPRMNRRAGGASAIQQSGMSVLKGPPPPGLGYLHGTRPLYQQHHPQHRRAISSEAVSGNDSGSGNPVPSTAAINQASMVWKSRLQGPPAPMSKYPNPMPQHPPPPPPEGAPRYSHQRMPPPPEVVAAASASMMRLPDHSPHVAGGW